MAIGYGNWGPHLLPVPWTEPSWKPRRPAVLCGAEMTRVLGSRPTTPTFHPRCRSAPGPCHLLHPESGSGRPVHRPCWQAVVITSALCSNYGVTTPKIWLGLCLCSSMLWFNLARINFSQETSLSFQPLASRSTLHFSEYKEMPLVRDGSSIVHKGPEQSCRSPHIMPAFMQTDITTLINEW